MLFVELHVTSARRPLNASSDFGTVVAQTSMSSALTRGILVTVRCEYIPERSSVHARQYAFAYTVNIANQGSVTAELKSRHWIITDSFGAVQEVRGEGVVGAQPVLRPGEEFEYTSWCVIATPTRDDARQLPDGHPRRRAVRRRDRALLADAAAAAELTDSRRPMARRPIGWHLSWGEACAWRA